MFTFSQFLFKEHTIIEKKLLGTYDINKIQNIHNVKEMIRSF